MASHFLGIATSRFELPLPDGCSRAGNSHRTSGCDRCGQPSSLNDRLSAVPAVSVQVPGLTGVTAIAAGWLAGYALRRDGSVWAWGNGGPLGDGDTDSSSVPVRVTGLTDVTVIAGGLGAAYALRGDGTVWAWGMGGAGRLGNGSTESSSVPVQVSGLTDATAIAAGGGYYVTLLGGAAGRLRVAHRRHRHGLGNQPAVGQRRDREQFRAGAGVRARRRHRDRRWPVQWLRRYRLSLHAPSPAGRLSPGECAIVGRSLTLAPVCLSCSSDPPSRGPQTTET